MAKFWGGAWVVSSPDPTREERMAWELTEPEAVWSEVYTWSR